MSEAVYEPGRDADLARLRRLFRFFGETQARGRSPVYAALSEAVAGDDAPLDLLLATPESQRRPSLLFAAVNLLLAARPYEELAAYYPIHGGHRAVDAGLAPAFAEFCARHRDALTALLRTRSTQTNEIRRCTALRLGLAHVHRHWPGPLALVELGTSAGLNLLFDRYTYDLGDRTAVDGAGAARPAGPAGSAGGAVVISCAVEGPVALGAPPVITTRLGVDREPVDLADAGARDWLAAFVWPEQVAELATLRGAIAVARATPSLSVVRGDAVTDTAGIVADLPGDEPVVVFTASLLSYLDADARTAFRGQVREAAGARPVAWVFAESPGLLAGTGLGVPALAGPLARRNGHYLVGAHLEGPDGGTRLLALADPYLRRLAPARGPADDFRWADDDLRAAPA